MNFFKPVLLFFLLLPNCQILYSMTGFDWLSNYADKMDLDEAFIIDIPPFPNPAKNTDGICHLARLPIDVHNRIAHYLIPEEKGETDAEFNERIKTLLEKGSGEKGAIDIAHLPSEIPFFVSAEHIDRVNKKDWSVIKRCVSANPQPSYFDKAKSYFITPKQEKELFLDNHIFDHKNYIAFLKVKYDLVNDKSKRIDPPVKPITLYILGILKDEKEVIFKHDIRHLPDFSFTLDSQDSQKVLELLNVSYQVGRNNQCYKAKNFIEMIRFCNNRDKVAIATNSGIYLSQKKADGSWSDFKLIKFLQIDPKFTKVPNTFFNTTGVNFLEFNKQGTKLFIQYWILDPNNTKNETIKIFEIEKTNLLVSYFRKQIICKNLSATS